MPLPISGLERKIGYTFKNGKLLEQAMTHRSWAFENVEGATDSSVRDIENETLEFVGDSVVGLVVAEELFKQNDKVSEGDLTLMKHHLVSTEKLAEIAKDIDLGGFLRVGRGEEKTGGRRKQALLANTFEALIAAVFFDGGYIEARNVMKRIFVNEFKSITPKKSLDYKTLLQETLQAEKLPAPIYNLLKTEGPSHQRVFTVEAVWNDGKSRGSGSSIKAAEMTAASRALKMLNKVENQ
ncbi:MAG: ribonuclease III [Pyrinomonadaceae bacterium]|nr:ribonuclease III [Pyrinomonadaceae bacterium]